MITTVVRMPPFSGLGMPPPSTHHYPGCVGNVEPGGALIIINVSFEGGQIQTAYTADQWQGYETLKSTVDEPTTTTPASEV